MITSFEIINPDDLTATDRAKFAEKLYEAHRQIFSGVSQETFINYVFNPTAEKTKIGVYRNADHQIIGYCATHLFLVELKNKRYAIYRAEAGFHKQYRGYGIVRSFVTYILLMHKLRHPLHKLLFFGSFVHPSVYLQANKMAWKVYPSYKRRTPEKVMQLFLKLAEHYKLRQVNNNPLVRKVGWVVLDNEANHDYWAHHDNEDARFFSRVNPGFNHGDGLLILFPISFTNLSRIIFNLPLKSFYLIRKTMKKFVAFTCLVGSIVAATLAFWLSDIF